MPPLRLIASAAYVDQELSAEFGQIPPAFLPIGVSRLYEAQIAGLGGGPLYLTIPEGFVPQSYDLGRFEELEVTLVPVPVGLRLGESIVYAINYIAAPSGPLQLLHGDTLIEDLPSGDEDLIAIHREGDDYSWAAATIVDERVTRLDVISAGAGHDGNRPVACGYFAFSSSTLLTRALTRARGDFVAGLNFYAQDRVLKAAPVEQWRDFGHIQTYFRSRRAITTARSFNTLRIDSHTVHKSSEDRAKMEAEAHWFAQLPAEALPYSARLLNRGDENGTPFYETEYQYAPTLSELFVFASIGRPTWRNILKSCRDFLEICARTKTVRSGDAALSALAVDKTRDRLTRYADETGFDIANPTRFDGRPLPSLLEIADAVGQAIDLKSGRAETVMHGDFCFSNILYNSRAARISVIDPRGYVKAGEPSLYGDTRYDLAKLSHSIAGYYDHILAGRYRLARHGQRDFSISFEENVNSRWLLSALEEIEVDGIRAGSLSVRAVTVALFLSMLPLHADRPDRQAAFIANALRLYADIDRGPA